MSVIARHVDLFRVNSALVERKRYDRVPDRLYRRAIAAAQRELDAGRSRGTAYAEGCKAMRIRLLGRTGGAT